MESHTFGLRKGGRKFPHFDPYGQCSKKEEEKRKTKRNEKEKKKRKAERKEKERSKRKKRKEKMNRIYREKGREMEKGENVQTGGGGGGRCSG